MSMSDDQKKLAVERVEHTHNELLALRRFAIAERDHAYLAFGRPTMEAVIKYVDSYFRQINFTDDWKFEDAPEDTK